MDEIELRVAALELILVELLPWLDRGSVDDAHAAIKAGLSGSIDADERAIRQGALQIIEDAQRRFRTIV